MRRARPPFGETAGTPAGTGLAGARSSSSIVFHSPQDGQRPYHFGDSQPQDEQTKTVLFLAAIAFSFLYRFLFRFLYPRRTKENALFRG